MAYDQNVRSRERYVKDLQGGWDVVEKAIREDERARWVRFIRYHAKQFHDKGEHEVGLYLNRAADMISSSLGTCICQAERKIQLLPFMD